MQRYLAHEGSVVEAVQLSEENYEELADLTNGVIVEEREGDQIYHGINLMTHRGVQRLSTGWWLIVEGNTFDVRGDYWFRRMYAEIAPDAELRVEPDGKTVELLTYENGEREVIGEATLTKKDGHVEISGRADDPRARRLIGGDSFTAKFPRRI